VLSDLRVTGGF